MEGAAATQMEGAAATLEGAAATLEGAAATQVEGAAASAEIVSDFESAPPNPENNSNKLAVSSVSTPATSAVERTKKVNSFRYCLIMCFYI